VRRDRGKTGWRWYALVAALLVVAVGLGGATASATREISHVRAAKGPPPGYCSDPSPGECTIDPKSHCPVDGPLGTQAGQCETLPATLVQVNDPGQNGSCLSNTYIQVQLKPGLDSYEAVWYSEIGEGTRWWQSPGTTYPNSVTGEGATYKVPKGDAAWSAAGGANSSGGCPNGQPPGTFGAKAWGIPSCGASSAADTAHVAAAACCPRPDIEGQATRDTSTGDVTVDLTASRLATPSVCRAVRMSITNPAGGLIQLNVNRNGSTATAHRKLVGPDMCLDLTRATVSDSGGRAHRTVQAPHSVIRIVPSTSTAHRTAQGAISVTVTAKHFLPACGKRDFTWKSSDGTVAIPIVKQSGSTATAKRTLPSGQDCAPDGNFIVVQPQDPWSRAHRTVLAPSPVPRACKAPGT
jgi:hypothetical protein